MLVGKIIEKFETEGKEVMLRYPTMQDVKDLQEHINSLIEEGAKITMGEKQSYEDEVDWLADSLKDVEKGKRVMIVPEVDGKVMGMSSVTQSDKKRVSHTGNFGISVKEEIRDKGIGTRLAKSVLSEAKKELDVEIVGLSVYKNNEVAKKLYRKLGFEKAGEIKDGIKRDGKYINKVIMQKDLRD